MKHILLISFVMAVIFMFPHHPYADADAERLAGADRFEVAVNISKKGWPEPSDTDTVIIANYLAFADALSAAPLAVKHNAPILLTQSGRLNNATRKEITRLSPSSIYIVGGSGSISEQVEAELSKMGLNINRVGGQDRFDVSLNIARELDQTKTAVLASGLVFSDALSIAPYAAAKGYPILLTRPERLPAASKTALKEKGIEKVIVSGGEGSINGTVFSQLPAPQRIGGKDRFAVSANIVRQLNMTSEKVFTATGLTFADALTGSVLAAKMDAPMLLTRPDRVPADVFQLVKEKNPDSLIALGGTGSVSDSVIALLKAASFLPNGFEKLSSEVKQAVAVKTDNSTSYQATVEAYEKRDAAWAKVFGPMNAAAGKNGFSANKVEGDGKTPAGIYELGYAFGSAVRPAKLKIDYRDVTAVDYWIDDPKSKDYNTWVRYYGDPYQRWNSFERLNHPLYKYAVLIRYNENPIIKGKGSAIFFHVWRSSSSPTLGCVALPESGLLKMMNWLDEDKKPTVILGTQY